MIQRASQKIVLALLHKAKESYDHEQFEVYVYGVECSLANLIQIVCLVLSAFVLGIATELLAFCLVFTTLKRFCGGWHAGSHFTCITGFTLGSAGLCLLAKHLPPSLGVLVTSLCLSVAALFIVRLAPIPHPNHPKDTEETARARVICRWILLLIIVAIITGLLLYPFLQSAWVAGSMAALCVGVTVALGYKERRETKWVS